LKDSRRNRQIKGGRERKKKERRETHPPGGKVKEERFGWKLTIDGIGW